MQTLKQVLKPDWRKVFLFAILISIAIGGQIQAWAFSKVPPKPLLYDLLQPFPLWELWMYLLLPLALLTSPLRFIGLDVMAGPAWLFWTANTLYAYLLACFIITSVDRLRSLPQGATG